MAYSLNKEQLASVDAFIAKLPDSMVKSHIEKLFAEVRPTKRILVEQMEKFVSFSNAIPDDLQDFPQGFSNAVKNNQTEDNEGLKKAAHTDLIGDVNESISDVKAPKKSAPENKEEILHKLGTEEGSVEQGTKTPEQEVTSQEKKEGLKRQRKEGDEIVARNAATTTDKAETKGKVREGAKLSATNKAAAKTPVKVATKAPLRIATKSPAKRK